MWMGVPDDCSLVVDLAVKLVVEFVAKLAVEYFVIWAWSFS